MGKKKKKKTRLTPLVNSITIGLLVFIYLLVSPRLLVSARFPVAPTPPGAYSSHLFVFARLHFPTVHTRPNTHMPPDV